MARSRQFTLASSESLSRADSATLSTGDIDFSLAAWVYLDTAATLQIIMAKSHEATNREYAFFFDSANSKLTFRIYDNTGTSCGNVTSTATMSAGRWYFCAAYHDSVNNLVGVSLNGAAFDTAATTGVPTDTTSIFRIGAHFNTAAFFLNGRIARAGFWKSRILTAAECLDLMNGDEGYLYASLPAALQTNLTCYWNLNETSGNATDSVGSQTLTDTNTVTSEFGPGEAGVTQCCGFEFDADGATSCLEAHSSSGTFSIQSTTVRSGSRALKSNPTTTAVGYVRIRCGHSLDGGIATGTHPSYNNFYWRFYFYIETLPSADEEEFAVVEETGGTGKLSLRITSGGAVTVYNEDGTLTLLDTSGVTLSAGEWYRVEVYAGTGTATAAWTVRLYSPIGVLLEEMSGTGNLDANPNHSISLGKKTNRNGESVVFYYDDLAGSNTTWVGPGRSTLLIPNGDGTHTGWTGTYADVDDNPHDSDSTYIRSTTTVEETFTLPDIDVTGAINNAKILAVARDEGASSAMRIRSVSGATTTDSLAIDPGATYTPVAIANGYDPNTLTTWTKAAINALEIGVTNPTGFALRVTQVGLYVDYAIADIDAPGAGLGWIAPVVASGGTG